MVLGMWYTCAHTECFFLKENSWIYSVAKTVEVKLNWFSFKCEIFYPSNCFKHYLFSNKLKIIFKNVECMETSLSSFLENYFKN